MIQCSCFYCQPSSNMPSTLENSNDKTVKMVPTVTNTKSIENIRTEVDKGKKVDQKTKSSYQPSARIRKQTTNIAEPTSNA